MNGLEPENLKKIFIRAHEMNKPMSMADNARF